MVRWQIGARWEGQTEATLTASAPIDTEEAVGYIGSDDDTLAIALLVMGLDLPAVNDLSTETLDDYDALLVGGEAHHRDYAGLADRPGRLIEFARAGGRVAIFQLQDSGYREEFLPLPLSVNDEEAALGEIRAPDHPVFGEPNVIESLAGTILYDTITEADPGWRVLAVDDAGQPAVIEAGVGDGAILVIQPSIDRYVAGTVEASEALTARTCTSFLINVLHYLAS